MSRPVKFSDDKKEWFLRQARNRERRTDTRSERKRFLIVCEGAKTEPNYFEAFARELPPHLVELKVKGEGANTLSLVAVAQELRETLEKQHPDQPFDQVWVVFDRDSFPAANFDNAINMAEANNMEAAWSNEAFEFWYILHFEYRDTATSRTEYQDKLTGYLGEPYKKNDPEMCKKLAQKGNQTHAIAWASRLHLEIHANTPPHQSNPCSTVYKLVAELNNFKVEEVD